MTGSKVSSSPSVSTLSAPSKGTANLDDFAGRWHLRRKIIQQNGDTFSFVGTAAFCWEPAWEKPTLNYYEQGEVTAPNGNIMPAERRYFWQQSQHGVFDVLFDDERYFHTFSASNPNAEHLCGDDNYVVHYDFAKLPVWRSTWQVKGPRKDYTMISEYSPA
ncbi:DUF6314 family protein [Alteromonas mediterranea]|uniref:DUF6314 domain-containing protein n=1 Tax=Alteromonas mediterranea (strain DSM 17117 / CIP 110805 / LMG 28347 / Deep ecotype) TaxID=1774373 RepID=F2G3I8_ALTMD|nr:DUF6314 family protein [Alteromonas mediterranea]AEA99385.1 hypothetical protein MADE_1016285 [Alteromonas mediterranea DE]CAH1205611.1 hypothetical protein ISS312_03548 [Alteromonas mediterranea]|tara:strand:+ start:983 stop:1465 length:483 start_codon:yes stop_codon:yes gene_type:complete